MRAGTVTIAKLAEGGPPTLLTRELGLWLSQHEEEIACDGPRAKEAIELLAFAWDAGIVHALISGPLTAGELTTVCGLESEWDSGLLEDLAQIGLLQVGKDPDDPGRGIVHASTLWLSWAVCPLLIATRLEQFEKPGREPVRAEDVEALLYMAATVVPVIGEGLAGSCQLVVSPVSAGSRPAAVTIVVEKGVLVSARIGFDGNADCEAVGSLREWYLALVDLQPRELAYSGDESLALRVVDAVGATMFGKGDYLLNAFRLPG